ncbi:MULTISPECIES: Na+/H+ antiporter subunit G [Gammaproteobacteria]|uniref:Na+/H+ antiporter subunit G n=1 Tax=Gammaproteobacteria TaxID=1236 RepID=UPI000DCFCCBC|nr:MULTISPECIES: Na+/H+ antiporter subunit G [Gammaproteobacteria]RTE86645.1 Na+/H+ antiporter subunit G [Aliidiomarina sp. B3213]TCZ90800.1 Na+/H+ antiporter subunit G [Lysobacter sp. N42]
MPLWVEVTVSVFLLFGAFFALVGSIGLAKLPDFFRRLHGPTKATTLGVGGMILGSMLYFTQMEHQFQFQELLITLFLFITAPASAHIVAKAALHLKVQHKAKHTEQQPEEEQDKEADS